MIALDASVLIGHFGRGDTHAEQAFEILDTEEDLIAHPMTLAEVLVHPAREGHEVAVAHQLETMGVERLVSDTEEPLELARIRIRTGLRLPDACVLLAGMRSNASVATFDDRLARAARELGLAVLGV